MPAKAKGGVMTAGSPVDPGPPMNGQGGLWHQDPSLSAGMGAGVPLGLRSCRGLWQNSVGGWGRSLVQFHIAQMRF